MFILCVFGCTGWPGLYGVLGLVCTGSMMIGMWICWILFLSGKDAGISGPGLKVIPWKMKQKRDRDHD